MSLRGTKVITLEKGMPVTATLGESKVVGDVVSIDSTNAVYVHPDGAHKYADVTVRSDDGWEIKPRIYEVPVYKIILRYFDREGVEWSDDATPDDGPFQDVAEAEDYAMELNHGLQVGDLGGEYIVDETTMLQDEQGDLWVKP